MHKPMPPLNALRAFEAAARHLSLTRAAQELNVTAGALSHQIRGLEDMLGLRLFERQVRAIALTAAASYPDRVAAAASFHGGNLASDADTSPHLLASKIKAEVYIAAAVEDQSYPPEMEARLKQAFDAAHVNYRHETYAGAKHGWTKADFPVYDRDAAERAHRELIALFKRTLG